MNGERQRRTRARRHLVLSAVVTALAVALLVPVEALAQGGGPLQPGEMVYVNVFRHEDLSTTTQVSGTGMIQLPYVGNVTVGGLSEAEATNRVENALKAILKSPRVSVSRTTGRAAFSSPGRTENMQTHVLSLNNSNAERINEALSGMTSEGGNIGYDPDTNSLIITDTPSAIKNMLEVVQALDQMQSQVEQVHIEMKFAEVEQGALKDLGVRWFIQGDRAGGGYYPQPPVSSEVVGRRNSPFANESIQGDNNNRGNGGIDREFLDEGNFDRRFQIPVQIPTPGQMFFGYQNVGIDVGAMLDALVADDRAEMLASPYLRTVNHKRAEIRMVDEYPYSEVSSVGLSSQTTTRFLDIGIKLDVTPHIRRHEGMTYVQMHMTPEISYATGTNNGVPIRSVRSTDIVANVLDKQTLIIGGIVRSDSRDIEQGVPGLRKVPVIGRLFRHTEKVKNRRELMIFATPTVYSSPDQIQYAPHFNLEDEIHPVAFLPPEPQMPDETSGETATE